MALNRARTNRTATSRFSSRYLGVAIQLAKEMVVSAKVMLSESLVVFSICSRMARVLGDQVAQASTPPEIMAVTMAEASISIAVMSSMVMPAEARVFFRMSSLEVPEE